MTLLIFIAISLRARLIVKELTIALFACKNKRVEEFRGVVMSTRRNKKKSYVHKKNWLRKYSRTCEWIKIDVPIFACPSMAFYSRFKYSGMSLWQYDFITSCTYMFNWHEFMEFIDSWVLLFWKFVLSTNVGWIFTSSWLSLCYS